MASAFTAEGRAHRLRAVLVAAVLLVAVAAVPASAMTDIDVTGSTTYFEQTYSNHQLFFTGAFSWQRGSVDLRFIACTVRDGDLVIKGYDRNIPPVKNMLQLTFSGLKVEASTVTFLDTMPPNSLIRAVRTTATKQGAYPVFRLTNTVLRNNVTLVIESTTATWDVVTPESTIVQLFPFKGPIVFDQNSGLFILDSTVVEGSGVVYSSRDGAHTVSTSSAFAVDGVTCVSCRASALTLLAPLTVSNRSAFRLTKVTGDQGKMTDKLGAFAVSHSRVKMSGMSLYYMADIEGKVIAEDARAVFTSKDTATLGSAWFSVEEMSTATFEKIKNFANFLPEANRKPIPTNSEQGYNVRVSDFTIAGEEQTDRDMYKSLGFQPTISLIDTDGKFSDTLQTGTAAGQCARASCVPGDTADPQKEGTTCACVCSAVSSDPFCIGVFLDPLQHFLWTPDPMTCGVENCEHCDSMNYGLCAACKDNYKLNIAQECVSG